MLLATLATLAFMGRLLPSIYPLIAAIAIGGIVAGSAASASP
jgi:hypothetical protein